MLKKLLTAAFVAGAITGIIAAIAQMWLLQPLIEAAELIEHGQHDHDHGASHLTRHALTFAANIISFCGFALIMVALMECFEPKPKVSITFSGILWGVLGYFTFILAPTLGLPPNLPGMPLADIEARQIWWVATAITTSLSLWVGLLAPLPKWRIIIAIIIFLAPHIYGAPSVDEVGEIPAQLSALFAVRSVGISFVAWLILGVITANLLYKDSQ